MNRSSSAELLRLRGGGLGAVAVLLQLVPVRAGRVLVAGRRRIVRKHSVKKNLTRIGRSRV